MGLKIRLIKPESTKVLKTISMHISIWLDREGKV